MHKSRRVLITALGTMTPALLLEEGAKAHAAHRAGAATLQRGVVDVGLAHAAMKTALLALSPGDKLRIAGDRVRLAAAKKKATGKSKGKTGTASGGHTLDTRKIRTMHACPAIVGCSGMLFTWN